MLIAVSGKAGSGKDYFASVAVEEFGAEAIAFASGLKEEVHDFLLLEEISFEHRNLYGTQADKEELISFPLFFDFDRLVENYPFLAGECQDLTFRTLLQKWGTEYRRYQQDDYWVQKAFARITDPGKTYVITDCRFPNEAQAVLDFGGQLLRIDRPQGVTISNMQHPSEIALDDWEPWTLVVPNYLDLDYYRETCRTVLTLLGA